MPEPMRPLSPEMQGRLAFDSYRFRHLDVVCWDWADMGAWEQTQWVEWAKTNPEAGSQPPSLRQQSA